jgi:hypothetical protein
VREASPNVSDRARPEVYAAIPPRRLGFAKKNIAIANGHAAARADRNPDIISRDI